MFGGYDPAYNPESLEKRKAKAEQQELSQEQQEIADKWAASMNELDAETTSAETTAMDAETAAPASAEIQHFNPHDSNETSNFQPLSPEEQRAQMQASTKIPPEPYKTFDSDPLNSDSLNPDPLDQPSESYDEDNLVVEAIVENSGKGSVDLNSVGQKLESDGVAIADEVENLQPDIANDLAKAGTEDPRAGQELADELAIDAAASALAAKEKAADTISAIENESITVEAEQADFEQTVAELDTLIDTAENTAVQAGKAVSEKVDQARKLSEEAKDAVTEAENKVAADAEADQAEVNAKHAETNKADAAEASLEDDEAEDKNEKNTSDFNPDDYPELKDLGKTDRQSIFA